MQPSNYKGLNQETLRLALFTLYFGMGEPTRVNSEGVEVREYIPGNLEAFDERMKYIIPLQGNWEDPITEASTNTYIQYWIEWEERISMDANNYDGNGVYKMASILLRFVGGDAENWAKMFHHLSSKSDTYQVWEGICNSQVKEYIGRIVPRNIDFAGRNSLIAYDVRFRLTYLEELNVPWNILEGITLGQGEVKV